MRSGRITYVGHATLMIELDGTVLLTDPLLRDHIGHVRRIVPVPETPGKVDAVLLSHAHRDHLDVASLRRLEGAPPIFAPPTAAAVARGATNAPVTTLVPGERVRVGDVDVTAVHAEHDGRRVPIGPSRTALGFVVAGSSRIYFAGDTDLFDGMVDLAPDLDVALVPVWGWGPKVGPGHLDPERAARAVGLLRPRAAIPIHWGTYASRGAWWRDDPERPARDFARLVERHAPGVAVTILAPGRSMALRPGSPAGR